jgi:voltage-gated potassium channel Kch
MYVSPRWFPIRGVGRFNILERRVARFFSEPPTVRGATAVIVTATFVVTIGAGILMTLLDSTEFPDLGVGLWWAVQTVTTVGYGDVAPKDAAGRLVGTLVMLEGTAFIAIVTAVITSSFVTRAQHEHDVAQHDEALTDREAMEKRFDELERKIDALAAAQR